MKPIVRNRWVASCMGLEKCFGPDAGNCGITAIALSFGLPFDEVFHEFKKDTAKPGNWKGSSRDYERHKFIKKMSNLHCVPIGKSVRETHIMATYGMKKRRTFNQWLISEPNREGTASEWNKRHFIVSTRGHVQVVCGGIIFDQNQWGVRREDFRSSRRKVYHWVEIFDSELLEKIHDVRDQI